MTGYQTNLTEGFAQLLAAAGVGAWNPTGVYQSTDLGILLKLLNATPDNAIALTAYPVTDDPTLSDTVTGLQVMTRAGGQDPRPVDDIADAVFNQLQGLHDTDLATGVHVVLVEHKGGSSMGQDDLHRWSRVDNYYVTAWRPSSHRQ